MARVTVASIIKQHPTSGANHCHWFDIFKDKPPKPSGQKACFADLLYQYQYPALPHQVWYVTALHETVSIQEAAWFLVNVEAWVDHSIKWRVKKMKGKPYLSFLVDTQNFKTRKALLAVLTMARYPYEESKMTKEFFAQTKDMGPEETIKQFQEIHKAHYQEGNYGHKIYAPGPYGYSKGVVGLERFRHQLASPMLNQAQAVFS